MSCSNCNCNGVIIPKGPKGDPGPQGPAGPAGESSAVTVKDANGNVVTDCTEIRFTDSEAVVTDLGNGIAEVKFVPATTVWNDIENLANYADNPTTATFRPQYTIEGNKISFRGMLYIPLEVGGSPVNVSNSNSYKLAYGVTLDESRTSIVQNANSVGGVRQGRFLTSDVVSLPNFPAEATPTTRDITFSNVDAYRRYAPSSSSENRVTVYRSIVTLKIGCSSTIWVDPANDPGAGCLFIFSPYQDEYEGGGASPLGNDPLALLISKATSETLGADYVTATDDNPFTIGATDQDNPFDIDAHNINNLGGFIINLEGLSGYLN